MRIISELKLDFDDILIQPKRSELSSRKNVFLEREFITKSGNSINGIPIIAANMATGNFTMAKVLNENKIFTAIAKHNNDLWNQINNYANMEAYLDYCFYTIGMNGEEVQNLEKFYNTIDVFQNKLKICIDIANGYSQKFADYVRSVRAKFPNNIIMVGNVCTPEMTQELILAGADIIKIGIGPGSACSTRYKTGVGYPQISACIENSDVAHGLDALICLDGGMKVPGDIAKAFCANADFVMIGGMLSGTDECDGEVVSKPHCVGWDMLDANNYRKETYVPLIEYKKFKKWYGMSSNYAQNLHSSGTKEYRTSEGIETETEYIGPVQNVVNDILGGLRSCGTYIGAKTLKQFGKCATFVRVMRQK